MMVKGLGEANFDKYSNKYQLWQDINWFHQILEPESAVGTNTFSFELNDQSSFGLSAVGLAATDYTSFVSWKTIK